MSTAEHVPAAAHAVPPGSDLPVPTLLRGLVDDAALFPPGNAPMPVAVTEHRHHVNAPYAALVGPLLCPTSRWDELLAQLATDEPILDVGLIADSGIQDLLSTVEAVRAEPRVRLVQVECRLASQDQDTAGQDQDTAGQDQDAAGLAAAAVNTMAALAGLGRLPRYLEIARGPGWLDAVRALAAAGDPAVGAKLRTGGLSADAFPKVAELAAFVALCAEADLPFKLTAGLHHAVRHTDGGIDHHGYLNVLAAVCLRRTGVEPDAELHGVTAALASRSPAALTGAIGPALTAPDVASAVRAWFHSYGSCSIAEPLADLAELDLLPADLVEHLPAAREDSA